MSLLARHCDWSLSDCVIAVAAVGWLLVARPAVANDDPVSVKDVSELPPSAEYQVGYASSRPVFGGPNSPEGQLEEFDRTRTPALRFPAIDEAMQPVTDWRKDLNEKHGIQLSTAVSTLSQKLSDSLSDEDSASSVLFRSTVKWTLFGRGTNETGALLMTVDYRDAFTDIAPASLGAEAGYIGQTGLLYSDFDWAIINLNWQQGFNDGDTGLVVGRYDPNDYMNVLGYIDPQNKFSNLAINLEPSVAFPDSSWGVGAGHWIDGQWYVMGGVNDANGVGNDNLEFFDGGSEFFTWSHLGWSPSKADRYFKNVHIMGWHVDDREDVGLESSHGVAMAANWMFNDRWMPFARLGWSEGSAPIYNESASLGLLREFLYRSDVVGVSVNWGSPPDENLKNQTTWEAFWRFQFAQNLAITPSVQLLQNPAQNPVDDSVWVYSLRFRLTI